MEGSLNRLRIERIGLYQLHAPDNVVSFDVSIETLAELKDEGKIRMVALSDVTQEHMSGLAGSSRSPRSRTATVSRSRRDYVVDYCQRKRDRVHPVVPARCRPHSGDVLNQVAQAHHASPTQVAPAWLLQRSSVVLSIPGTSSIEHLEQNVAALLSD